MSTVRRLRSASSLLIVPGLLLSALLRAETETAAAPAQVEAAPAPAVEGAVTEELASLLKLGKGLSDRGDFDAAAIAYHQVLKNTLTTPEQVQEALLGLARMHRKEGTLTKAVAVFERFLKDYPGDARVPEVLLDLGRTQRAMGAHQIAITRFYSVINSTLKLPKEGFDHYQQLAKTAQFEIAETHFQSGNFAEAQRFFSRLRLLDLVPEDRARAHFKPA